MEFVNYNTDKFNFRNIIESILETDNLEKIHLIQDYKLFVKGTDQSTVWHRKYYDNLDKFLPLYNEFIKDVVKPTFGEDIVYQKIPTFRTQLVNNLGVFEFHRDRDYSHNEEERNFFLPFTDAYSTNTIWVESEEDKADYSPMNTLYGQVVKWNGNSLMHGNKQNNTLNTRVSVDFRCIPLSKYSEEEGAAAIYSKMKFKVGDYYEVTK
jgi:ectoine hydroxylase-related dioxygenase (phytanoyl-CoA dioxygenase family)